MPCPYAIICLLFPSLPEGLPCVFPEMPSPGLFPRYTPQNSLMFHRMRSCGTPDKSDLLYTNTHLEDLDDFVLKEKRPISKFHIVCVDPKEKTQLKDRLSHLPGVFPISTTPFNIEICCNGWSKREGLKKLCEILQISSEEIAAIGDSENDYEMIQWAGCGIAMGNADEKVKNAAQYVTGSNEEDGIVQALRYLGVLG